MSQAIALSAASLQKAKERRDSLEAQYHQAVAEYESAKAIHQALELSTGNIPHASTGKSSLCQFCQGVTLSKIFKPSSSSSSHRRRVGDLFNAVENQSWCALCKFLVEAFQIGAEDQRERLHTHLKPRDTAIYLSQDPDGKAWYTKAGIDTNLPSCSFAWLQTGPPTKTGQPHICVSFQPPDNGEHDNTGKTAKQVSPRQRGALEAFNGSLNYEVVQSWLAKCRSEHGSQCQSRDPKAQPPLQIYLVDVLKRQLLKRDTNERFVALSYVWGRETDDVLYVTPASHKANGGPALELETDTFDVPKSLPQTMLDAMLFVERLGERYLWIDQLCIDQTNAQEKRHQISMMDEIFASAYLTLVSLDGPNADWGLSGVTRPLDQTHQPSVQLEGGSLMATFIYSNWDNNGKSIWDTRAWTLQERLLSRRCILFARTYVAMTCQEEFFHDCLDLDPEARGMRTFLGHDYFREDGSGIALDDVEWDFKNYDALVSVFSGRKLTDPMDVLNACKGSLNKFSKACGIEFEFGMPTNDYCRASIWQPHSEHILTRRSDFPSWSWAGWTGRIEYAYWVGDMATYLDEDSDEHIFTSGPPPKRRRTHSWEMEKDHPKRAKIMSDSSLGSANGRIQLESTIVTFQLRRIRRDGEQHKSLKPNSQQSKVAIGDQWTLVADDGRVLRDAAGEFPAFELTDSFFRLKPEYSEILIKQDNAAEFIFVEHWPRIRDSATSNKWLYDMVSALLIIRNEDGTAWRLASILVKGAEWYRKDPTSETIILV